ncbi:phosphate metabolism protein 7 [Fusarium oxysporum]|nr:phosphate metabolism protein 7 [Fusarium oxysporum]
MREFFFYVNLRQAFLLTPQYAKRISSRTVLFTSVPKECLDEDHIRSLFNGSAKKIWIAGDTKQLDRTIQERDNVVMKLEKAEIEWIRLCNKERIKYETKTGNEAERATTSTSDPESGNLVTGRSREDKRPTHREGPLGLIGEKVDTIQWGRKSSRASSPKPRTLRITGSLVIMRNTLLFRRILYSIRCAGCFSSRHTPPRPSNVSSIHRHKAKRSYLEEP